MKTKLRDKLVTVQVINAVLIYSLDCISTKEANIDDVIEIPQWMVEGLVKEERVTEDIEEVEEEESEEEESEEEESEEEESEEEESEEEDAPLSIVELKELTETDFEDLKSTADCITWAEEQVPLADLTIHPACKLETSIGKILEACAALTVED
jgi:hypothetical protein